MRILKAAVAVVFALALSMQGARADEGIAWGEDLDKALSEAKKAGKPVLIDFGAEWCFWCRKMTEETFPDPGVRGLAGRYVCVRVNTDQRADLAERYAVKGLPTLLILDPQGKEVRRVDGFRGAEIFTQELEKGLAGDRTPAAPLPVAPAAGDPAAQQGGMENPLPAMASRMIRIRERLESEETGKGTQEEQEKILEQLTQLIQQAEQAGGG